MQTRLASTTLWAVIVLSCWGCGIFSLPTVPSHPPNEPSLAIFSVADVVLATNNQRIANGRNLLVENQKLNMAADYKMRDMFARQYFGHFGPDHTSGVAELLTRFGYYGLAGENLTYGDFKNANEVITYFMTSPGHRDNILDHDYRDIGIGIGYDMFKDRRVIMIVQIFGTPSQ